VKKSVKTENPVAQKSLLRGRFTKEVDMRAQKFSASHSVDRALFREDIRGSVAHATMLQSIGILNPKELKLILKGLDQILKEIESGNFVFQDSLEDIHMHIESRLTALIGDAAAKLHTGRSRNDQVAIDFRVYCRESCLHLIKHLDSLTEGILRKAKEHENILIPGYTHLQQAQVIRAAHHFLAYIEMFERDRSRLWDAYLRMDECPLGVGAIAGTGLGNLREKLATDLGFSKPTANSLDTVSDRDFALELLFAISMIALHLSRFCEEIVIWFSSEFSMIELGEAWCTGSSLMPQKKNPDIAELIRGKTGRFLGNLVNLYTTIKALPLSYNRDMQEDKESVFDSVQQIHNNLIVFTEMLETLRFKKDILSQQKNDHMLATDVAEFLVKKGIPFRKAHEIVGALVRLAVEQGKCLKDLAPETLKTFTPLLDHSFYALLNFEKSADAKSTYGGTARTEIRKQIKRMETLFQKRGEKK
jgi:argininosuccinate lyase